jgi:trans-2-enoyl-CoA reductase
MAKIVIIEQHGNPVEVVKAVDVDPGQPGPGEVLVSNILASVNPADLNAVEGTYPVRPKLPGTPGVEGAGVVERVGEGVTNLKPGTVVILPHGLGCWREACVVPASKLVAVPEGVPYEQAAMLKINPATAWRMLHDFVTPEPGAWIIQNAANSAVGRSVIVMAKELGLKTINLVRRPELIPELKELGADVVILDDESAVEQATAAAGGKVVRLALNAIGGESTIRIANTLANGGTVVTYGAMSRQPVRIPNGLLIFKDLCFRGFWVSKWYQTAPADEVQKMFTQLFEFARRGLIHTPVEKIYPVADIREAVAHASRGGRGGKILLGQPRS